MKQPIKNYLDSNMMPQVKHNPPYSYGDCYRTAFCVVMGLEHDQLPHFLEDPKSTDEEIGLAIENALKSHGWGLINFTASGELTLEEVIESASLTTTMPFILCGGTANSIGHCNVINKGQILNNLGVDLAMCCPLSDLWHIKIVAPTPNHWLETHETR